MKYSIFPIALTFLLYCSIIAQNIIPDSINVSQFYDSAHHWYDINEEKVISPLPDQKRYNREEIQSIANNILLYQKNNGGWPKNYDMLAILTEDQKKKLLETKSTLNTTFDNGATHSQLSFLAEVYTITKEEKYLHSFLKGMNFLLSAQYKNGGWPQCFPDTIGYQKYITFNDGAMIGILKLLHKIVIDESRFSFLSEEYRKKIKTAFAKGLECVLKCQIVMDGKPTAWCQQHDNITLEPRGARTFEPAAISNLESAEIILFLMSIKNPSTFIINSINLAVEWFEKSKLHGIRVELVKAQHADYKYHSTDIDKIVIEDKSAPPIWTRYYDLKSLQPIFCNRDGKIVYSLAEVERERRTGYTWYTYDPQTVLDNYHKWKASLQ